MKCPVCKSRLLDTRRVSKQYPVRCHKCKSRIVINNDIATLDIPVTVMDVSWYLGSCPDYMVVEHIMGAMGGPPKNISGMAKVLFLGTTHESCRFELTPDDNTVRELISHGILTVDNISYKKSMVVKSTAYGEVYRHDLMKRLPDNTPFIRAPWVYIIDEQFKNNHEIRLATYSKSFYEDSDSNDHRHLYSRRYTAHGWSDILALYEMATREGYIFPDDSGEVHLALSNVSNKSLPWCTFLDSDIGNTSISTAYELLTTPGDMLFKTRGGFHVFSPSRVYWVERVKYTAEKGSKAIKSGSMDISLFKDGNSGDIIDQKWHKHCLASGYQDIRISGEDITLLGINKEISDES